MDSSEEARKEATTAADAGPPQAAKEGCKAPESVWAKCWRVVVDLGRAVQLALIFLPVTATSPLLALPFEWATAAWLRLLVRALETAGPTFVKLGQWAATRPDLFPRALCGALSRLHDRVAPAPVRDMLAVVEAELGTPLGAHFDVLDPAPIGCGCIAMVFAARLREPPADPSGPVAPGRCALRALTPAEKAHEAGRPGSRLVAVKVQRPGMVDSFARDLRLIHRATAMATALAPSLHWLSLRECGREFEAFMTSQLDFRREAQHLATFSGNFSGTPLVSFPAPMPGMVTERVLVESLEAGVSVARFMDFSPEFKKPLADVGLHMFLQMVLVDNFCHSDLHPGNMLARFRNADGSLCPPTADEETLRRARAEVVLVDAGLVTRLSPRERRDFIDLFAAVAFGDGRRAARLMLERGRGHGCAEPEAFVTRVEKLIDGVATSKFRLQAVEIGAVLQEMTDAAREHRVRLDPSFTQLVVSIVALEGVGRQLDPTIDIFAAALPYLGRALPEYRERAAKAALSHAPGWLQRLSG